MVYAYSVEDEGQRVDTKRVDSSPRCPLGTRLVNNAGEYRYACAGEDIGVGVLVEPSLSEEDRYTVAFSNTIAPFAKIIFGKVVAVIGDPREHSGVLGWPDTEVKKGQFFWIREVPLGATLIPEVEGGVDEP